MPLARVAREEAPLELVLQNASTYAEIDAPSLRRWIEALVRSLAPAARSVGVRLCGDRAMRAMNRDFRGRDYVTDVLSFPGSFACRHGAPALGGAGGEYDDGTAAHLGDVVVCVPQARRQAAERGEPLEGEVRMLLLHGLLHCMGHDHETDSGEMETLERGLRRRWLERS